MEVEMIWLVCGECGAPYGMAQVTYDERRRTGGAMYCVNGHPSAFKETEAQRLQKKLDAAEAEKRRLLDAQARLGHRLDAAERAARRFKCPSCPKSYDTSNKLLKHTRATHQAPLRLAAKAGPCATNTNVGAK